MKKDLRKIIASILLTALLFSCCFSAAMSVFAEEAITNNAEDQTDVFSLEDGVYSVKFDSDSSMFHVNEVCESRAELTVEKGSANLHLIMPSKNILNLFTGSAEDAVSEDAEIIYPGLTEIVYPDGFIEDVYTFDVPITVLNDEFDLALVGKKGTWYDHKVSISDPVKLADIKTAEITLEGGTGKVSLLSPARILCYDSSYSVTLSWSSKFYDYMIVDGIRYEPVTVSDRSEFVIPVEDISVPLQVIADTVAMSVPHEIEYVITFNTESVK